MPAQEHEDKVKGYNAPANREECEVIMLIGFSCSGKTTYVKKVIEENPDKK